MPKLSEGELPKQDYTTEQSGNNDEPDQSAAPKRKSALDDIFDTQEENDYDRSTDRATRLAYLNSLGSKKKAQPSSSDDSTFRGSGSSHADGAPSSSVRGSWKGDSIFKSPSKTSTRSKLEQQEFVKDSVQSKIARESAPALKQATSKSIDFGALMQKISDRQKEIKLPTAEQVGLSSLLGEEGPYDAEEDELSLEEAQEDDDEISLEIDEDEDGKDDSKVTDKKPATAPFKAPALPVSAPKSKKMVLDEEDDVSTASSVGAKASVAAPSTKPRNLFSLDDFELEDDDKPSTALAPVTPSLTQTMDILPELPSPAVDDSSQTSVTESSLQLEYPATLEPEVAKATTTPAGLALKSNAAEKPSLLSSWLAKTTTTKKTASPTTKAKSEASISRSKSKQREALDAPLFDGELLDENAMTGNDDSNGPKLDKSGSTLKRLQKTRQLFDDEAEAGYGSEGDQIDARERDGADSADESEGGASQDAYENEGVHPSDEHKKRSALDDIFETDDRAVVRSLQVQQEMERERAEQKAMEDMAWRRERRSRRYELALHAEANALLEDRRMEDRLAARRSQKRDIKTASKATGGKAAGAALGDSASLPVPLTEKEWFMDDSDEEKDDSRQETERRRLELLDEQQTRRRLASNSHFLSHDEDSQSILQVIERANTQHSQHSNPASFEDHNSSSQYASANPLASSESQDSLGGWFDRPGLASSNFSASNAEHLSKLKSTYKGHATQVLTSSLLFQRSQDGFEGSQDGFKDPAPLTRSQSNVIVSANSKRKK